MHNRGREMLNIEKTLSVLDRRAEVPSVENFICILQNCRKRKNVAYAKRVHAHLCNNGLEALRDVGNYIAPMLVECGSVYDAQQVFNRLLHRNEYAWTSLIAGYIQSGQTLHALNLRQKMEEDTVHPSKFTFMALLKACARIQDKEKGRQIHVEIAQQGFDDPFVTSSLIDMYAKCGLLPQAREVFDKLPVRNVVSWAALIAGYAEYGPGEEALKCFVQMQQEGISPDGIVFVFVLKACGSIRAIGKGQELHADIAQKGFDKHLFVCSTLVDMYAKCGSLSEAQKVFDKLPIRDIVSWAALIAGYVEHGPGQEALKCFERMQLEGISPDIVMFASVLKSCGSIGAMDKGREIHSEIACKGLEKDLFVGNSLVDMYAKCGSLSEARKVFVKLPVRSVVSWAALIAGYAEHGPGQEALNIFAMMQVEGVSPDTVTFVSVLKACGSLGAIAQGQEIHAVIAKKGFERDLFVGNTLIDMYAKCGSLLDAQNIFDKLPVQNVVSWTALIGGYAEHGPSQQALKCFEKMQLEGISCSDGTIVGVLKACGRIKAIHKGQEIHAEIIKMGSETNVSVANTLIDMYARCGLLSEAREVFEKLPGRDVVSWTTLIAGYGDHGPGQEGLKYFEQMILEGICSNAVTFSCVLKVCGSIGAISKGQDVHAEIAQKGFESDLLVGNTLVDMYVKCGSLSEAREVFDKLPIRSVVSWNSIIKGYGMNHKGNIAIQCFEDMQEQGVKPDAITFTCLLSACGQASLVFKGQEYFKIMKEEYGIAPTVDHYTHIINLVARSGYLYEAEKFLDTIQCPPSEETWTALLSVCKTYGEAEIGHRCFQQLVQMNPESAASYMHMANIYLSTSRWDDAYRVEESRKHARANKKPATAMIEVNKVVSDFVIGGTQSMELSGMIEILSSRMKGGGHVPSLDLVLRPSLYDKKDFMLQNCKEKPTIAFELDYLKSV